MRTVLAVPILAVLATASLPARAAASIAGKWLTEDGKQVMEIAPCSGAATALCARVLENRPGSTGEAPGTKVMWGLTDAGSTWKGKGYNKANRVNFRAELSREGKRLKIRGCKAFICRNSYWSPAP